MRSNITGIVHHISGWQIAKSGFKSRIIDIAGRKGKPVPVQIHKGHEKLLKGINPGDFVSIDVKVSASHFKHTTNLIACKIEKK